MYYHTNMYYFTIYATVPTHATLQHGSNISKHHIPGSHHSLQDRYLRGGEREGEEEGGGGAKGERGGRGRGARVREGGREWDERGGKKGGWSEEDFSDIFYIPSYTCIYLCIPLYTFIYFHIPPNTLIYLHILENTQYSINEG